MVENLQTGALEPFSFSHLRSNIPEMQRLNNIDIDCYNFDPPIDSSDLSPEGWRQMVKLIDEHYVHYDGFVILHGTDTMAYSASALSFMCENLTKPIILTGSQLPISRLRTDGKENLITALEIAAQKDSEANPMVPEVTIYMQNLLLRGNRTIKFNADNFSAFRSPNAPFLAETGLEIRYSSREIIRPDYSENPIFHYRLDPRVVVLKLFPGITPQALEAHLSIPALKGVVLETYGTGNSPIAPWFIDLVSRALKQGIVLVNVTQCVQGRVEMHRYKNGQQLEKLGVVSGHDITSEAALTKLMYLFGRGDSPSEVRRLMPISLRGELTPI